MMLSGLFTLRVRDTFYNDVYALVRRVPVGRVTTYGAIALALGHPNGARQVGWAMAVVDLDDVPAHRVVNAAGGLSGSRGGVELRRALLLDEGVEFDDQGRVRMDRYFWEP
jgi:methylated-DNA-protein-cysteine methyltransferase related protein